MSQWHCFAPWPLLMQMDLRGLPLFLYRYPACSNFRLNIPSRVLPIMSHCIHLRCPDFRHHKPLIPCFSHHLRSPSRIQLLRTLHLTLTTHWTGYMCRFIKYSMCCRCIHYRNFHMLFTHRISPYKIQLCKFTNLKYRLSVCIMEYYIRCN